MLIGVGFIALVVWLSHGCVRAGAMMKGGVRGLNGMGAGPSMETRFDMVVATWWWIPVIAETL
jgi:hypothetical protein